MGHFPPSHPSHIPTTPSINQRMQQNDLPTAWSSSSQSAVQSSLRITKPLSSSQAHIKSTVYCMQFEIFSSKQIWDDRNQGRYQKNCSKKPLK